MKIIKNKREATIELKRISNRTNSENNNKINEIVQEILNDVKTYGDLAVEKYTKKFDGFDPNPMQVSANDLKEAWNEINAEYKNATVGLQYGVGVDIAMINIDLRVEKGFQAISENLTIGETSFAADQRLEQIMLSVGIKF